MKLSDAIKATPEGRRALDRSRSAYIAALIDKGMREDAARRAIRYEHDPKLCPYWFDKAVKR